MSNETRTDGAKAADADPKAYLDKSFFLDFDSPTVQSFVAEHTQGANTDREKAIALFYAVRDKIRYNPYGIAFDPATYKASAVIEAAEGMVRQQRCNDDRLPARVRDPRAAGVCRCPQPSVQQALIGKDGHRRVLLSRLCGGLAG